MKINYVYIQNFRGIDKRTIEFKNGFNLVKGRNGTGKTSILEAIAIGLGGYVAGVSDVGTRNFSKSDIRKTLTLIGDGGVQEKYEVPMQVKLNAEIEGEDYSWLRERKSVSGTNTTLKPRDISQKAETMSREVDTELPVLINLGAGRVWTQKKEKVQNLFEKKYARQVGYTDTLQGASNTKLLLNWCTKMEVVAFQNNCMVSEYEAVKAAVARFMDLMEQKINTKVFYDRRSSEMVYVVDGEMNWISDLSAGFQSLVWMVFEIAYRMAVLNPHMMEDVTQTRGVVLIDELDLHLHPSWQWRVIDALIEVFPNVQFIATTHSPILFTSSMNVQIIDIEGVESEYTESHLGLDINSSMDKYQDTSDVAEIFKSISNEFYKKIEEGDLDKAGMILDEILRLNKNDTPDIIKMRTILEFESLDLGV